MLKEKITYKEGLPVNILVADVKECPVHFHDEIEIVYILAGTILLKNGYYSYTLNRGDVFVLNGREIHSFHKTDEGNKTLSLHIDVSYFSDYYNGFGDCFFVTEPNDENSGSLDALKGMLERIVTEILKKGYDFENRVIENTFNLISCLMSDFRYTLSEGDESVKKTKLSGNKVLAGRLYRIIDYMYGNYTRKLTLSEIAEREQLSIFYLSHAIKESTGLSFQNLLSFIRVEESEKLLLGANKKVSVISDECGFSAVRYYIKHFNKWYGMPPAEYKSKYTGKVNRRETKADYEKCSPAEIEEAIKERGNGAGDEHTGRSKPEPYIYNIDIEHMLNGTQKYQFPEEIFSKEIMKAAARPFNLFKNLNEYILFSSKFCMVSTSGNSLSNMGNISILAYNYDEDLIKKLSAPMGKETLLELLRAYEAESEMLIRCIGLFGSFKITRYKMTRQNVISACEEWSKVSGTLNKRQALLNSWSTLPNIEAEEIDAMGTLNLRFSLSGFSAELILLDRK